MAWDALVLNAYLGLNLFVVVYLLWKSAHGEPYNMRIVTPLVILSIPLAISIHTVTAFLYNGFASRPYWNSAILAPRFLASAFCSGPAVLHKIAELMAYAMGFNLFLFGVEIFKEYYSNTTHLVHYKYLLFGLHGEASPIALYAWTSIVFSIVAFLLFLVPATRKNFFTMNAGALLIYFSVYIEKGIALIIPGYTPDPLGQIYQYVPSMTELQVSVGIFGTGFLIFTVFVRTAIVLVFGDETSPSEETGTASEAGATTAEVLPDI
jgi:molybdopterin-containing oxidoreductase family membrane subunit